MRSKFRIFKNPRATKEIGNYPSEFTAESFETARAEISSWPDYQPTPLVSLDGFARAHSIDALFYKDESYRFGLGSFKSLGGAYAVCRLLQQKVFVDLHTKVSSKNLRNGRYRSITENVIVSTATEGNHGRSVAWGAKLFHCGCVVFLPNSCSSAREAAIRDYGARIIRTNQDYDETVRECAIRASRNGWHVVSDTSWDSYTEVPALVMQGYTITAGEVCDQLRAMAPPTHIFVQAGVGGLAAAVVARLRLHYGPALTVVIVEPEGAACLYASAIAGEPTRVPGPIHSIMSGLVSGEVSPLAWQLLSCQADYFSRIPDSVVQESMKMLAFAPYGDMPIVAGESAVAGVAALDLALQDPETREVLELLPTSRVLVFGTEGATDPAVYQELIGESAHFVREKARTWRRTNASKNEAGM